MDEIWHDMEARVARRAPRYIARSHDMDCMTQMRETHDILHDMVAREARRAPCFMPS